jgi:sulfur carrier protein
LYQTPKPYKQMLAAASGSTHDMTISLNGEKTDARGAATVAELVERYKLPPQTILIEHNGLALHRHEWPQRALSDGDQIELVRVVAGG